MIKTRIYEISFTAEDFVKELDCYYNGDWCPDLTSICYDYENNYSRFKEEIKTVLKQEFNPSVYIRGKKNITKDYEPFTDEDYKEIYNIAKKIIEERLQLTIKSKEKQIEKNKILIKEKEEENKEIEKSLKKLKREEE